MSNLVTGLFPTRAAAEQAVNDLESLGYNQNDISVALSGQTRQREFAGTDTTTDNTGHGSHAAEGAGVGAGLGGTLGAIVAALTATGSVAAIAATGGAALPLVAGPLAAALAGAGAGGLTGGLLGGLIGAGVPEDRARTYDQGIQSGGIFVGVEADNANIDRVQAILQSDGATNIETRDTVTR